MVDNYLEVMFLALLVYDHLLTLDKEIEWMWTLQWRLPKLAFIFIRYVITPLLFLQSIPNFIFPLPLSFCNAYNYYVWPWVPILTFVSTEVVLIIRVSALYGHHKHVVWPLRGFFLLTIMGQLITLGLFSRTWHTVLFYKFLPGCWLWNFGKAIDNAWSVWLMTLSIECVLMLLTGYKWLSYRNQMNNTIAVIARDSFAYFVIIFGCLVWNLADDVGAKVQVTLLFPTQIISSIAAGRMMMNIRGLVLDDPEHTAHLCTLQFTTSPKAGSEVE